MQLRREAPVQGDTNSAAATVDNNNMVTVSVSPNKRLPSSRNSTWVFRGALFVVALWIGSLLLGSNIFSSSDSLALKNARTEPLPYKLQILQDNEFSFMFPKESPKGILIFFHGCEHSGEDMFMLPEDRIVALLALSRGLVVLSITSHGRETGCWSKHLDVTELEQSNVVENWIKQKGLNPNLPRIGIGASSGGAMAIMVHKVLKLRAVASYIMAKPYEDIEEAIPTVFVHMPRDVVTAHSVQRQVQALKSAGIPALELAVDPHPFTEQVCNQRIPELGEAKCKKLLKAAHNNPNIKLLDNNNNVLETYTSGDWDKVLDDEMDLNGILKQQEFPDTDFWGNSRLRAAVTEEIAVAYGMHEMTAEHAPQVLNFLMKHAGIY